MIAARQVPAQDAGDAIVEIAFDVAFGKHVERCRIAAAHGEYQRGIDIARIVEHRHVDGAQAAIDLGKQVALDFQRLDVTRDHLVLNGLQRPYKQIGRRRGRGLFRAGHGRHGESHAECGDEDQTGWAGNHPLTRIRLEQDLDPAVARIERILRELQPMIGEA